MLIQKRGKKVLAAFLLLAAGLISACSPKTTSKTPTLLSTTDATQAQLVDEVNRFARVDSVRSTKVALKFEDNSFAQFGSKEIYRSADGEVVVQRPGQIILNVKVPVLKTDVAKMTSDGEKFRVAILYDSGGKYKKFVKGSNNADYSKLQSNMTEGNGDGALKQNVSAFANLRPQHFTDAMLVRPTDDQHLYLSSTTFQIEEDATADQKSPLRKVNRGYYLLDEYEKRADAELKITRRFWFDRIGGIRLARQQIFDKEGEIETDIVYGAEGNLGDTGEYSRLPLQILVTRPQEKYAMRLTYLVPDEVKVGTKYPDAAFVLQNTWGLEEVDLDQKLREVNALKPAGPAAGNQNTATRFH